MKHEVEAVPSASARAKISLQSNRSNRSSNTSANRRTGKKSFVIERKAIDDPDKELSRWVIDSFGKKPESE